ncbi:MAG: CHASE domain-containing protein [Gammaproteobacteria bacterium]|nr:CHASE domain-containing protein [Gammaproteobacteria bacterium]
MDVPFCILSITTRLQFSTFSEELLGPYPYIRSVLSLRRVSASERPLLEQMKQDSGYFQFQISELAEQGKLRPAGDRPEYLIIDQIEPLTPKISQLLGYDAQSNPEFSAAIDAAVRTEQVVASMPTLLLRGSTGLLVFKARYQGRYPPNTEGERQTMLDGAIAVALDTDAILKGIIPIPARADIFLRYPGSGSIDQVSRHSMNVEKKDTASVPAYLPVFSYRRVLNIYGQSAVLEILQQAGMENITAGWLAADGHVEPSRSDAGNDMGLAKPAHSAGSGAGA